MSLYKTHRVYEFVTQNLADFFCKVFLFTFITKYLVVKCKKY